MPPREVNEDNPASSNALKEEAYLALSIFRKEGLMKRVRQRRAY